MAADRQTDRQVADGRVLGGWMWSLWVDDGWGKKDWGRMGGTRARPHWDTWDGTGQDRTGTTTGSTGSNRNSKQRLAAPWPGWLSLLSSAALAVSASLASDGCA
ncbi:hypothetical protein IAQ61_005544 [Plenodomus lingam]|uniref:uncharacterized protein n=1 Tax=Leptosphaeria maculans TaxID=5022 RepID=UPI003318D962|nr:hypothetical protein IAQ61_005544 [Plenodomus lingam]